MRTPSRSRCWSSPTCSVCPRRTTRISARHSGPSGEGTNIGGLDHEVIAVNPLAWADEKFSRYIEERRENPRDDVLTSIATAKYPDGSTPEVVDVVRTATFLFAAGQETTAKLLGAAMRILGDRPDIQQQLRDDRSLIPVFVEECLRMDSPVKSVFRMARKTTTLGDTPVPAGTTVMVSPGAANRDPNRFENPHEFSLDRKNVREHIAFSRGIHSCPGAPLARVEGRVSIERMLDRMGEITVDEEKHGPIDARAVRLRADVHPARAHRDEHRVHARRVDSSGRRPTGRRAPSSGSRPWVHT